MIAGSHPAVSLEIGFGEIIIEVRSDRAPLSAAAFLRYVDEERYIGAQFTRVVRPGNDNGTPPITITQVAADPRIGPPTFVPHEATRETGLSHIDGAVSFARGRVGTGTPSAFFICLGRQPCLDAGGVRQPDGYGFAVFGRVLNGMDFVRQINNASTLANADRPELAGQLLTTPVRLMRVRRLA